MNYSNQMMNQAQEYFGRPAIMESADVRSQFLGKVYALLGTGLVLAGGACVATLNSKPLLGAVMGLMQNPLFYILAIVGLTFGVQAVARIPVLNVVGYGVFTLFFGAITAPLVMMAVMATGSGDVVVQALGLTAILFVGLSAWALTTKEDLSRWGTYLFIGALILFGIGVVGMFTSFNVGLWWSALWVALLAGYVMYDTQMIQRRYAVTDVVPASIALFTDFIVMFWHILRLLSRR
ncbi:MAG: hypothetical protein GEEBNDBF_01916 [bacterium]|nr:hypothetical protein [bacterium]